MNDILICTCGSLFSVDIETGHTTTNPGCELIHFYDDRNRAVLWCTCSRELFGQWAAKKIPKDERGEKHEEV